MVRDVLRTAFSSSRRQRTRGATPERTAGMFVDLDQAFDSVPKDDSMLAILKKFGIKGKMWDWIANCYTDVTVKATVNERASPSPRTPA